MDSTVEFHTNAGMPDPPKSFTLFPLLPKELQIRILLYACHIPRIIEVSILNNDPLSSMHNLDDAIQTGYNSTDCIKLCLFFGRFRLPPQIHRVPSPFNTSLLAREVALKACVPLTTLFTSLENKIYYNPAVDTLYIRNRGKAALPLILSMQQNIDSRVRHLALKLSVWYLPFQGSRYRIRNQPQPDIFTVLTAFKELEEVLVVMNPAPLTTSPGGVEPLSGLVEAEYEMLDPGGREAINTVGQPFQILAEGPFLNPYIWTHRKRMYAIMVEDEIFENWRIPRYSFMTLEQGEKAILSMSWSPFFS